MVAYQRELAQIHQTEQLIELWVIMLLPAMPTLIVNFLGSSVEAAGFIVPLFPLTAFFVVSIKRDVARRGQQRLSAIETLAKEREQAALL